MNPVSLFRVNSILFAVCMVLVITLAIASFDNPTTFNISFMALLVIIGCVYFGNKNIVSLFVILLIERSAGQLFFVLPDAIALGKIVIYAFVVVTAVVLRYQILSKLLLASLLVTLPAEVYWYTTDYSAPAIYFYYIGLTQIILVRYFLLMRIGIFRQWQGIAPQNLDFNVSEVMFLNGLVNIAMISEYLVRHLLGIDMMWVYISYEYIQHMLSALMVMLILFYTVSHPNMLRC